MVTIVLIPRHNFDFRNPKDHQKFEIHLHNYNKHRKNNDLFRQQSILIGIEVPNPVEFVMD